MMRSTLVLFFLFAIPPSLASAETYTWTDGVGTVHFTEDLGTVPRKIRKNVRRLDDVESSPAAKSDSLAPGAKLPDTLKHAAPLAAAGKDGFSPMETYAGKTYDQWQKEFSDQEAAMTMVRKRIDEIVALVKSPATRREDQQRLISEHNSLVSRFKEMKDKYNQQVESARKAGLQVNIQQ